MTNRHPFFHVVLILGGLALAVLIQALVWIARFGDLEQDFGWVTGWDAQGRYIAEVTPTGPAAGKLAAGDRLIAINGDTRVQGGPRFFYTNTINTKISTIPINGFYTIEILRAGSPMDIRLNASIRHVPLKRPGAVMQIVVALVMLVCALLMGLLRPDQRITQLGALYFLSVSVTAAMIPVVGLIFDFVRGYGLFLCVLCSGVKCLSSPLGYDFFWRFPPGVHPSRFWSLFRFVLYPFGLAIFGIICVVAYLLANPNLGIQFFYDHSLLLDVFWKIYALFTYMFTATLWLGVLIRNYRSTTDPDQRHRIQWFFFGVVCAAVPIVLYMTLFTLSIFGIQLLSPESREAIFVPASLFTIFIPITLIYSILKHRVMDVRLVIRRGLQYLFARNVLWALLLLPLLGVVWNIASNPNRTLTDIVLHNSSYFYLLIPLSTGVFFRKRLVAWIDRKFFREAYSSERILLQLIEQVQRTDTLSGVSHLVHQQLDAALHPKEVAFYYKLEEEGSFDLDHSSGSSHHERRILPESDVIRLAEGAQEPAHRALDSTDQLIIPVKDPVGRLTGIVMLGEKKSEEPYSAEDRKLLKALAAQIGMVYENTRLRDRMNKEERVRKEVLDRLEGRDIRPFQQCPACGRCYESSDTRCALDSHSLELALPVERTIDGKFRLERLLGKGGMGAVYEAQDLRLGRLVAVKILLGAMFGNATALRRFEREAEASARLNHPNIITVHDFGTLSSQGAYLIMERLEGASMRDHLRSGQSLHPAEVADWFRQLLDGLAAAHAAGIIHRDLKPENVFITKTGHVKILDFGLAKILLPAAGDTGSLTAPGTILGTLCYMSPEQLGGNELDERSDIFSCGVMVAEAVTGHRPFEGRTATELVTAILHQPFHLSAEAAELDLVLRRCLAKNREDRYATVGQLQQDLIPAIRNTPWQRASGSPPVGGSQIETAEK